MKSIEQIKQIISEHKTFLTERYKVKSLEAFGSYSRGEQTEKSDFDILVEFSEPVDLFDYVELEEYLSELLHIKVDLVMKSSLKPFLRESILKEASFI